MFDYENEERELLIEKLCDETLNRMLDSEMRQIVWDFLHSNFSQLTDRELLSELDEL